MVTHIGMKLSTHTYYFTPMTHKWFPWQQPTTNSLGQFSLKSGTISGIIFNQRTVVEELDVDRGTEGMSCDCSSSSYCYVPAGHVVTGDLTIIRDAKLRSLVRKGPS